MKVLGLFILGLFLLYSTNCFSQSKCSEIKCPQGVADSFVKTDREKAILDIQRRIASQKSSVGKMQTLLMTPDQKQAIDN